jgi:hypothetical protein
MEDPQDWLNTVSAANYDRKLTNKLYEISSNIGALQLQDIISDNIKIENENNLNIPSSSSSSFSDLDSFKEEDKGLARENIDSEDETDNETAGGESSTEILPELPFQAVQDNNNSSSNSSIARPKANFIPKPPNEGNILCRAIDNQLTNMRSSLK